MEPITTAAIAIYVGDKILAQIIKDEVWIKRLLPFLFPTNNYKSLLTDIIYETIDEFKISYSYDKSEEKYAFYDSEIILEHLSLYILFSKSSLRDIELDFTKHPKIVKPTSDDLDRFYDLFFSKVSNHSGLKSKFIEENYRKQIYELSTTLESIKETIDNISIDTFATKRMIMELKANQDSQKLSPKKITDALTAQIKRQLKKQVNSGKYLKDTFIETGRNKDYLRYLTDSIFYSEKCYDNITQADFSFFNIFLSKRNYPMFDFEASSLTKIHATTHKINSYKTIANDWLNHLIKKEKELSDIAIGTNQKYAFERKIKHRITDISFLKSKVALVTDSAGQGKTNFLCDLAENFLSKRNIPTAFITGTEINPNDIRNSILKSIFPDANYLFQDFIDNIKLICENENKFFVLIIDGINENINPQILSQTLEKFISELVEYDFFKIIISCRTEYFDHNFTNLLESYFKEDLITIPSLLSIRHDDNLKRKLFDNYFNYFKIQYTGISDKVYNQLVSNFLLLRIFCDTYSNSNIGYIDDIFKEELFEKYYSQKSKEINKKLAENDAFNITGNFNINDFIQKIATYMINKKVYINVPLTEILEDKSNIQICTIFLDENILVKRDLQSDEKGIFSDSEVVNFTFDEFRDFIISKYLVEKIYPKSVSEFTSFIESEVTDKSPILEGCSTFLFFISRKKNDATLNAILETQQWHEQTFNKCIFSLNDFQITDADIKKLNDHVINGTAFSNSIVYNLLSRINTETYKKLNIEFLFEKLRELNDEKYTTFFIHRFSNSGQGRYTIPQNRLLDSIERFLENKDFKKEPHYHRAFELLIYMFTNLDNWNVIALYEKYHFRHKEISTVQLKKALQCSNTKLSQKINKFIKDYAAGI